MLAPLAQALPEPLPRSPFPTLPPNSNNEVHGKNFPDQRCNRETGPSFNASEQNGFWLVRPDMTLTDAYHRFQALINGSQPAPPPPKPPTWTRFNDSDVTGNNGGAAVKVNSTDPSVCELPCLADGQCTAAVLWDGTCWLKYGGSPTPSGGRVLLLLDQ